MKYYKILRDNENYNPLFVNGIATIDNGFQILKGNEYLLPDVTFFKVTPSEFNVFTDVLSSQFFMVSRKLIDILKIFDNALDYRCMFVTDEKYHKTNFYYIPIIPTINCLVNMDNYKKNKSIITIKSNLNYPFLFKIGEVSDKITIVSLLLAEAILRRNPLGVKFEKVYLEEVLDG